MPSHALVLKGNKIHLEVMQSKDRLMLLCSINLELRSIAAGD
jgi:hypothetical protein